MNLGNAVLAGPQRFLHEIPSLTQILMMVQLLFVSLDLDRKESGVVNVSHDAKEWDEGDITVT
jgi:hypothetical protein